MFGAGAVTLRTSAPFCEVRICFHGSETDRGACHEGPAFALEEGIALRISVLTRDDGVGPVASGTTREDGIGLGMSELMRYEFKNIANSAPDSSGGAGCLLSEVARLGAVS